MREPSLRVLILLNPVAGLGGSVGLKGSDGVLRQTEAIARGARPMAASRAALFLKSLALLVERDSVGWIADDAVASLLASTGFASVTTVVSESSDSPAHTTQLVREHADKADLVLFVGGDGTARDVLATLNPQIPCLGIPAGVKMHSGVFAVSPQAGAKVLAGILRGELVAIGERDVRDYDEDEKGIMTYGQLRVPEAGAWLQQTKSGGRENEMLAVAEIIADLSQGLLDERPLVIGPGGTTSEVKAALGQAGTLRGFDIVTKSGCAVPPLMGAKERSIPSTPPSSAARYWATLIPAVSWV